MKKYCKNIDITNRDLISEAVYTCLSGKWKRPDVIHMFSEYSRIPVDGIRNIYKSFGTHGLKPIIDTVIDSMQQELINRSIILKEIWYTERIDSSSHKIRRIGIQDIKQQIYDYVAVIGMKPFLKRIGEYQVASIKTRGQIYGTQRVAKWLRNKSIKYAGKADIQKCYESIDREKLMEFLNRHIKNDTLLWLIRQLIYTFEKGLSIGSYLSQFLCNLYLSQLYHEIAENMYRIRKHRNGTKERINLVKHVIFYMDDILILGTNAKDLHKAMKLIMKYAETMGLTIKQNWCVFKRDFVDMMGFRIYNDHVTIRRCVFKRIRRCYMRIHKKIKLHKKVPMSLARRAISYYGLIKNSDSFEFVKKYKVIQSIIICKKVVSNNDKSKIQFTPAFC